MPLSRLVLVLVLAVSFVGATPLAARNQDPNQAIIALSNQDIVEMMKAGLSPEIVLAKIKASSCRFDTSPAALKELKIAAVPDSVILAMVEASSTAKNQGIVEDSPKNETKFAHLRIYRQRRYTGSALAPSIYVDDRQIVRVGNGRRCTIRLSPGPHSIRSDDKSSAISLDAKDGQEYFIRVDEALGFWKGHGKLTLLLPEQGSAEYQLQQPVEEDRRLIKEMLEDGAIAPQSPKDKPSKKPN